MGNFRYLIVVLGCLLAAGSWCGVLAEERGQDEAAVAVESRVKPAQIVVIGSDPFITDMRESCTPGHLRSVLEAIRPDIIAVDATAEVIQSGQYYAMDLKWVVVPWAKERQVRVAPIGCVVEDYNQQVQGMLDEIREVGHVKEYKFVEDNLYSALKAFKHTFKFLNSEDCDGIWRRYHKDMQRVYDRATPWQVWNGQIASNLIRLGNENPGKRIAVVIEAAHSYFLKDAILNEAGLTLLNVESSLNFDKVTLKENSEAIDHLHALRPLAFDNFGQLPEDMLIELETHLQRLRQYPEYNDDVEFFRGKMYLHRGKSVQAVRQFMPMTYLEPGKKLMYDEVTPIRDAAMIYIAVARYEQGDVVQAKNDLVNICRMKDVDPEIKAWANRIMQDYQPYHRPEVMVDLSEAK